MLDIGIELLKHFCKSFAKDCKIKLDDLRDDVPDEFEVIDVDVFKIKNFFTDDAWIEIQRRGI